MSTSRGGQLASILSNEFKLVSTGRTARVELYADRIRIVDIESEDDDELRLSDVIGTFAERPYKTNDNSAYLIINAYSANDSNAAGAAALNESNRNQSKSGAKRVKLFVELAYSNDARPNNLKYNMIVVQRWHDTLKWLLSIDKPTNDRCVPKKPYLVFVNPYSGSGKACKLFIKRVAPLWSQAAFPYKIVLTG
jgi:hypothetical protein